MRRILTLVPAAVLVLSLAACDRNRGATDDTTGDTGTTGTTDTTTDQTTATPTPPPTTSDMATSPDTTDTTGATGGDWEQMKANAEARWKSADSDGDDALSRTETASAMPEIEKQFDKFDGNSDGKITRDEMHNFKMEDSSG